MVQQRESRVEIIHPKEIRIEAQAFPPIRVKIKRFPS